MAAVKTPHITPLTTNTRPHEHLQSLGKQTSTYISHALCISLSGLYHKPSWGASDVTQTRYVCDKVSNPALADITGLSNV